MTTFFASNARRVWQVRTTQRVLWVAALLGLTATWVMADPIVVNCDQGQSLNHTLAKMNKAAPATVLVKGTCTEFAQVNGFEGLTLKRLPGATLQQPSKDPDNGLAIHVWLIEASRSVTIDGFAIHSGPSAVGDIGIDGTVSMSSSATWRSMAPTRLGSSSLKFSGAL